MMGRASWSKLNASPVTAGPREQGDFFVNLRQVDLGKAQRGARVPAVVDFTGRVGRLQQRPRRLEQIGFTAAVLVASSM
jgi:hypothetical protein